MRSLPNIERSAFRRGEYVGYGAGLVWRITKSTSSYGNWCARPNPLNHPDAHLYASIYAFTLVDLSRELKEA